MQRWVGTDWGRITLDRITLTSPSDGWPPTIRLDYRLDGESRVDEELYSPPAGMSLESQSNF